MTDASTDALETLYCRRCSYPLTGLSGHRCPECGTSFDPSNHQTFRLRPKMSLGRRAAWAAAVVLLISCVCMIPAARRYYAAWQQQRFVEACAEVRAAGGEVWSADQSPATTPANVKSIVFPGDLAPIDVQSAAHLKPYLQRFAPFHLDLQSRPFRPGAFAQWAGLRNVRKLSALSLTDADLPIVSQLPNLEALALSGKPITDQGIAALKGSPSLRCVVLMRTSVTRSAVAQVEATSPRLAVFFPSVDLAAESRPPPFEAVEIEDESNVLHSFLVHRDGNGKQLWSTPFPGEPYDRTLWNEERVFQPQSDGINAYDAGSGKWLWRVPNLNNGSLELAGDFLLIVNAPTQPLGQRRRPIELTARSASDGKTIFDIQLPSSDAPWGSPLATRDLILLPVASGAIRAEATLALDHSGQLVFRVHGHVIAAMPAAGGMTCLLPGSVEQVRPDGSIAWTLPIPWGDPTGQLLQCPDGDLIGFTSNQFREDYSAIRFDPTTGSVRWRYTSPGGPSNHFFYSLEVNVELRRGLLAFSRVDNNSLQMMILDAATAGRVLEVKHVP